MRKHKLTNICINFIVLFPFSSSSFQINLSLVEAKGRGRRMANEFLVCAIQALIVII